MKNDLFEHKVRVFISSIINTKYMSIRKALKHLLEETSMVDVYAFETACASSQDIITSYIEELGESDLCIFIIDNADGCTDPVFMEYSRAKELQKPSIFIFCNETCKEWTKVQVEVTKISGQKWKDAAAFSDIPYIAYQSAMNDIVRVYRRHAKKTQIDDQTISIAHEDIKPIGISRSTLQLSLKYNFDGFAKLKNEFKRLYISRWCEATEESSSLDGLCSQLFLELICQKKMPDNSFDTLLTEIKTLHSDDFTILLERRISAIKEYFNGNLEECLKNLKLALEEAKKNEKIPNWILLDILVDCRNINSMILSSQNEWAIDSEYQNEISENLETVYYPVIDRLSENHNEKNLEFMQQKTDSPYTSRMGGFESLFLSNMEAFVVATTNASLTQLLCTRDRLIDSLKVFCSVYTEHDAFINLLKLLIVAQQTKEIKENIDAFGFTQSMGSVNENDVKRIMNVVCNTQIEYRRVLSKFVLMEHFGYYMSDEDHKLLSDELVQWSFNWLTDDKKFILYADYIFKFLRSNARRLSNEKIVEFVTSVLNNGWARWIRESTKTLNYIDFTDIPKGKIEALVSAYIELSLNTEQKFTQESSFIQQGLMILAKNLPELKDEISNAVLAQYKRYYETDYSLELDSCNNIRNQFEHIKRYIEEACQRNLTQGKNGSYSGYAYDPFTTILNILKIDKPILSTHQILEIITAVKETLLTPTQTYSTKFAAVKLILFILNHQNVDQTQSICNYIIDHEDKVKNGKELNFFDKSSLSTLSFMLMMLKIRIGRLSLTEIQTAVSSYNNQSGYEIIKSLEALLSLVDGCDFTSFDANTLLTLLQYAIFMCYRDESDARYYSNRIVMEFTRSTYSDVALECLSHMMDNESPSIKIAIVKQIKKLEHINQGFKEFILQKARVDNHYLVRREAISFE